MKRLALASLTCTLLLLSACSRAPQSSDTTSASPRPEATKSGEQPETSGAATASGSDKKKVGETSKSGSDEKPQATLPVQTAPVRFGVIPQLVGGYGNVAGGANNQATLSFAEAGRIASVDVTIGAHVPAGEILARLDPRPFEAELSAARANVAVAEAGLTKARLGVRPQQIAETDAQLRGATTQTALAKAQLERQQKLLGLGIAPQSDVDAARAALAGAKSGLDVLQQQRSTQVHPWQPDIDAAGANVAQAESAAYGARQKLALAEIVAPFAGVVVARMHNDGESVDANAPVIQIAADTAPVFTAQFSPEDASRLSVGDPATIQAEGVSGKVRARVIAINSLQGDAHTVAVLMRMHANATAARAFGPGAYGQASVQVGTRRGLVVPAAAIVTDAATGAMQVFRKNGDRYDPVPIGVVARSGDRAIVSASSLRPGDRVATEGAYELLAPAQAPKKDSD